MSDVKVWRTVSTRAEHVQPPERGRCTQLDIWGWPCLHGAAWVLAWTVNESGLPNAGTQHTDFVCHAHLAPVVSYITAMQTAHVTVSRYEAPQT